MNLTEDLKTPVRENMPVFFTGLSESDTKQLNKPQLCIVCGSSLLNKSRNKNDVSNNEPNSKIDCQNCTNMFENVKKAMLFLSKNSSPMSSSSSTPTQSADIKPSFSGLKRKSLLPIPKPAFLDDRSPGTPRNHSNPKPAFLDDRNPGTPRNHSNPKPAFLDSRSQSTPRNHFNPKPAFLDDRSPSTPRNHSNPKPAFLDDRRTGTPRNHSFGNRERNGFQTSPNHPVTDLKRKNSFPNNASKRPRHEHTFNVTFNNLTPPNDHHTDKLSKSIWQLFLENKQTQEVYAKKMTLRDKLHEILLTRFPSCGLYVVGSSMTGLGGNSSDMDMCLMLTDNEIDQEKEATKILHTIRSLFLNYSFLLDVEVIYAKVPILRFTDRVSNIEVDLNINNSVGIRNTQLLSSYARTDKRLPPLVLLTKNWARYYGINDAKNNTLSSYSLVLMVIHYLQYGCDPPVLPCLQELQPDKYQPHSDVRKLKLLEDLPDFVSENQQNLGDLFSGFLKYFSHTYDYFRSVMSVRIGGILPKETAMNNTYSPKNKKGHWKWVCIEEPFDLTNTACAVFKPSVFRYMRQVFEDSWERLRRNPDLSSIID